MADENFSDVVLLLGGDGSDGATGVSAFVDSSSFARVPSVLYGVPTLDGTLKKFGSASLKLITGAGISYTPQDTLALPGDFTIEFWLYAPTDAVRGNIYYIKEASGVMRHIYISTVVDQLRLRVYDDVSSYFIESSNLPRNEFLHVAVSRSGDTWRLFLGGVLDKTVVLSQSYSASAPTSVIVGAAPGSTVTEGPGVWLDELRVTKGVARYTSGFAVPTESFIPPPPAINADLVAPMPTVTASGGPPPYAHLTAPSPTLRSASGGTTSLAAPRPTILCVGHNSYGEQAAFLTAPRPVLTIRTGANAKSLKPPVPTLGSTGTVTILATSTLTAPKPTLAATMTVAGMATADLSAPSSPTLASYTGAVVRTLRTTSKPSLSASVTVGSVARASVGPAAPALSAHTGATARLQPPAPTLAAEVLSGGLADAALSTTTRAKLVGYSGAVCSVSITGKPTVTASGTTGGVASLAVVCPLFELTAAATAQNHGSASLLAPSPRLGAQAQAWLAPPIARLTAIGSATITATYEAYAVNLGHRPRVTNQELPIDEVTHYTNFPFTHVVRYQNSYYGANSTGLYLLEGTTDAGTEIPWAVKTAMDDFKTPLKKTVASAYFGGRFGPASTVQLHAGEQAPNTYSFSTPRDALAQNHRQVFGKGVKERYYALGASGTGVCELDTVELETHNMTRRI